MDTRAITPEFHVAPQITVADIPALVSEGFTHIICNRPAAESAPQDQPDLIEAAARAAGLSWSDNPLVSGALSMDHIAAQKVDGKVLAYCASGTRSAILWALSQAGEMPADDILAAIAKAGYPMEQLRGQINMLEPRES